MCGVFGAVLPASWDATGTQAGAVAALGLFALQHRGQESAGLAVSDGEQLMLYKDLGLVSSVLDERRLPSLRGRLAIAHCRYSTTGSTVWENAQPTFRLGPRRALAIGHNGNLVNTRELLGRLRGGRARGDGHPRGGSRAAVRPVRPSSAQPVRLRAHLLRATRLVHGGPESLRGAAADGHGARPRASDRYGSRHARARHGRARGGRL